MLRSLSFLPAGGQRAAPYPPSPDAEAETVAVPIAPVRPVGHHAGDASAAAAATVVATGWSPVARGTVPGIAYHPERAAERRSGGAVGAAVLLLALAFVVALGALTLALFAANQRNVPGAALASADAGESECQRTRHCSGANGLAIG